MLRSLKLANWKSFGEGETARNEVKLGPLTVLVGPNGSGKSNALDGLKLLKGWALGLGLSEVLGGKREGGELIWRGVRGGHALALRAGATRADLTAEMNYGRSAGVYQFSFERVGQSPALGPASESLVSNGGQGFRSPPTGETHSYHERPDIPTVELLVAGGESVRRQHPDSLHSLLSLLDAFGDRSMRVTDDVRSVRRQFGSALEFEMRPSALSKPSSRFEKQLGDTGENLASVLYDQSTDQRQLLVDWLSELCRPKFSRIDFDVVPNVEDVHFALIEGVAPAEIRISARSLSDGTLRFLGILTALMTVPEGSIVVLEEPDVGLHPTRVHLLAELLESITAKRKIQVIATTHSPTLLANLSREAFANVVAFDRDPDTGWTVCSRVGDMEHKDTILDAPDRDHLIATGWLERAL